MLWFMVSYHDLWAKKNCEIAFDDAWLHTQVTTKGQHNAQWDKF